MKKFFSTMARNSAIMSNLSNSSKSLTQSELNVMLMQKRAQQALEQLNKLPPDERPPVVDSEDVKRALEEADRSRLNSVY